MILIYGTVVQNDISSCFFHFFKIFILWVLRGVKGQKTAEITKNFVRHTLYISGTIHHMIVIYGAHV